MPRSTIVVPAYNVADTIAETLESLLVQTNPDFEIIVVDDGSSDQTINVVFDLIARHDDPRIQVIRQKNRGLAGAHNTGIHAAAGEYIGFCDADDLWLPEKLAAHVAHLDSRPDVGISFSGSAMIDENSQLTGLAQQPRLTGIDAAHVLLRNPIGNGSAPVMRKAALEDIRYRPAYETERDWWFDETFRQSDDIEGWARFAATTDWKIEGVPGLLTHYRINPHGLSANVSRQLESWERMLAKLATIAPDLVRRHGAQARAYQHRYLCRRAIASRDAATAGDLLRKLVRGSAHPLFNEPVKTVSTLAAAAALTLAGPIRYANVENTMLGMRRAISVA